MFWDYLENEAELLDLVQKRFKMILSLGNNQQEEDALFNFEGIPQDLRMHMRAYLGSSIRRQAESYYGYAMASQIYKQVEDENKGESDAKKKKCYKDIFSIVASKAFAKGISIISDSPCI